MEKEWEKIREDQWHQTWRHKEHGERLINTELLNYILTSRDTYWKEREALNSEREYLRGFREGQKLEKGRVEEATERARLETLRDLLTPSITNEDNLK